MKIIGLLLFIFTLPLLAVIGHDLYTAYENADQDIYSLLEKFQWSDVGWLWVNYAPESYNLIHDSLNPAFWDGFMLGLLEQTAALVFTFPIVAILFYLLIARLFSLAPFAKEKIAFKGKNKNFGAATGIPKKKTIKYKRK